MARQTTDGDAESKLVELLPDNERVKTENREKAMEAAQELWRSRPVLDLDHTVEGLTGTVEVHKSGFVAMFTVNVVDNGIELGETGTATFEVHDERGDFRLEDIEVEAQPNRVSF